MTAYNVFVSHVWRRHHAYYWGLIRLLEGARRFPFVDLSIPKLRPFDGADYDSVREEILPILRKADVVLAINTPAITRSAAVRDELEEAERCEIPIIAIHLPKRRGPRRTSRFGPVERARKAHWTTQSIVDAIRGAGRRSSTDDTLYERTSSLPPVEVSTSEFIKVMGDDEDSGNSPPPVLSNDFASLLVRRQ